MPNFSKNISPDAAGVSIAAAGAIVALAAETVKKKGAFTIALSGGSTPKAAYSLMALDPLIQSMPWKHTHIYFGDERMVLPEHPDSNFRMAHEAMLSKVPIPLENVFPIGTEDSVEECAEGYEKLLRRNFPGRDFPSLDLVLLGIGPDGHTASLFPGTPAPKEVVKWVTTCDPNSFNPAIKPAVKRVTITSPVIWAAGNVFVLATGAEKTPMLAKIFSAAEPPDPPVSRLVRKCSGNVTFFLDTAAAG
jgi:6-phosphogluconolactonase